MTLKELLMNDSSWYQVYKFLPWTNAKELSKMVLLSMIIDADSFVSERLKEDYSYFMCTNRLLRKTYGAGWSKNTLNNYFNELRKDGFIDIRLIKFPNYTHAPRYVKINNQKLIETYNLYKGQNLTDNSQDLTDNVQNLTDNVQNLTDNSQNLLLNNNNQQEPYNNNTSSIEGESTPREDVFDPSSSLIKNNIDIDIGEQRQPNAIIIPTVEEIAAYAKSKNIVNIDVQHFFNHYEAADWKQGGKFINWKQKVLSWAAREKNTIPQNKPKSIPRSSKVKEKEIIGK